MRPEFARLFDSSGSERRSTNTGSCHGKDVTAPVRTCRIATWTPEATGFKTAKQMLVNARSDFDDRAGGAPASARSIEAASKSGPRGAELLRRSLRARSSSKRWSTHSTRTEIRRDTQEATAHASRPWPPREVPREPLLPSPRFVPLPRRHRPGLFRPRSKIREISRR